MAGSRFLVCLALAIVVGGCRGRVGATDARSDGGGATVDDAGTVRDDGGTPVDDAGPPLGDAGVPFADAGVPLDDGGAPLDDAGDAMPDADDGGTNDAGVDAGYVDAGPIPGCSTPLVGDEPFVATVAGTLTFGDVDLDVTATLWFPVGRAPGAPVYLSLPGEYGQPQSSSAVLDDTSSATLPATWGSGEYVDPTLEGRLVGPADGLWVRATRDFAREEDGDLRDVREGVGPLCATDVSTTLPAPSAHWAPNEVSRTPSTSLLAIFSTPLDVGATTVGVGRAEPDAGSPDADVDVSASGIRLRGWPRLFPPGATLVVAGSIVDVFGRVLPDLPPVPILGASAVIVDGTFTQQPPEGSFGPPTAYAWCGAGLGIGQCFDRTPWIDGLFAFADPAPATHATIDARVDGCFSWSDYQVLLLRDDGAHAYVPLTCDEPVTVALPPGEGTVFLDVAYRGTPYLWPWNDQRFTLENVAFTTPP